MLRRSHGSLLAAATWHAWHLKTSLRRFVLRLWLRRCLAENVVYVGDDGARLVGASALPPRRGEKLRLVVLSDTHTYEAALRGVPNGDALVHCGDVLRGGKAEGERHVADLGSQGLASLSFHVRDEDTGALGDKTPHTCLADPGSTTGDQGHAIIQFSH